MLIPLSFTLDSEGSRATFYYSLSIAAILPLIVWPVFLILYIIHAYISVATYSSVTYIVIKYLLFLIYNLIVAFFCFETLFPVYGWW